MKFLTQMKIGTKITVTVSLLMMASIFFIVFMLTGKAAKMQQKTALTSLNESAYRWGQTASEKLDVEMSTVRNLAHLFSSYEHIPARNRRKILTSLLESTLVNNKNIIGVWTLWEEDIDGYSSKYRNSEYGNESGRFAPILSRLNGGISVVQGSDATDFTASFFLEAKKEKGEVLLDPFYYSYTGQKKDEILLTSMAMPLYKDGRFLGVIGVDMNLEYFQALIEKIKPFEAGYAFLLSNNSTFVAHPAKKLVGTKISRADMAGDRVIVDLVAAGVAFSKQKASTLTGELQHTEFVPVQIGNIAKHWTFATGVPMNVVMAEVNEMKSFAWIMGSLAVLAAGFLIFFMSRNITTVLAQIAKEINKLIDSIMDGKLSVRGDVESINFEFQPVMAGMNQLIDTFVEPIDLVAKHIDFIAKGDMPPKVNVDYKGDFNKIINNLNRLIDVSGTMHKEIGNLITAATDGELSVRAKTNQLVGGWHILVSGINDILDNITEPVVEAEGILKQMTDNDYGGTFNKYYKGDYGKLIDSVVMLQKTLIQIQEISEHISKGDFQDLAALKQIGQKNKHDKLVPSLIAMMEAMMNIIHDSKDLSELISKGKVYDRIVTTGHEGEFRNMASELNSIVNSFVMHLDSIPTVVLFIDKEYNVNYLNKTGLSLLGMTKEQIKGKKCFELFHTCDCQTANCATAKAMTTGKAEDNETTAKPGNDELEIYYSASPLRDKTGDVVGCIEIVIDQTEKKKDEVKVRKVAAYLSGTTAHLG